MYAAYAAVLQTCPLFLGIPTADIPAMLACLSAKIKPYAKSAVILAEGSRPVHMGVVLAGSANIEQNDYWGNRAILAQVGPGELFAEAFGLAGIQGLPVNVCAAEACTVMLIDCKKIVSSCPASCAFHARLIQNMLRILAQKNVSLTQKMETLTQKTTRAKLLAYLSGQARRQGKNAFDIPFNRQELADYLSVDRSAMSAELSRMRREGLLQYDKNAFRLF